MFSTSVEGNWLERGQGGPHRQGFLSFFLLMMQLLLVPPAKAWSMLLKPWMESSQSRGYNSEHPEDQAVGCRHSGKRAGSYELDGGEIECVTDFKYLGSILESKGGVVKEVGKRIAEASCAFGALREPVFKDWNLSLQTKRLVYRGVVLGVVLYGSETWATKRDTTRKLEVFHHRCLRGILGVTAAQQRAEHISSIQVAKFLGMEESLEDMIIARRLRWLGHIARMDDGRIPKKMLFGWFPQHRPAHGARMRWRDRVQKDLRKFKIGENNWFRVSQERDMWREVCRAGLEHATETRLGKDEMRRSNAGRGSQSDAVTSLPFQCDTCQRSFRRRQDIARHRCVMTRPWGQVLRPPP